MSDVNFKLYQQMVNKGIIEKYQKKSHDGKIDDDAENTNLNDAVETNFDANNDGEINEQDIEAMKEAYNQMVDYIADVNKNAANIKIVNINVDEKKEITSRTKMFFDETGDLKWYQDGYSYYAGGQEKGYVQHNLESEIKKVVDNFEYNEFGQAVKWDENIFTDEAAIDFTQHKQEITWSKDGINAATREILDINKTTGEVEKITAVKIDNDDESIKPLEKTTISQIFNAEDLKNDFFNNWETGKDIKDEASKFEFKVNFGDLTAKVKKFSASDDKVYNVIYDNLAADKFLVASNILNKQSYTIKNPDADLSVTILIDSGNSLDDFTYSWDANNLTVNGVNNSNITISEISDNLNLNITANKSIITWNNANQSNVIAITGDNNIIEGTQKTNAAGKNIYLTGSNNVVSGTSYATATNQVCVINSVVVPEPKTAEEVMEQLAVAQFNIDSDKDEEDAKSRIEELFAMGKITLSDQNSDSKLSIDDFTQLANNYLTIKDDSDYLSNEISVLQTYENQYQDFILKMSSFTKEELTTEKLTAIKNDTSNTGVLRQYAQVLFDIKTQISNKTTELDKLNNDLSAVETLYKDNNLQTYYSKYINLMMSSYDDALKIADSANVELIEKITNQKDTLTELLSQIGKGEIVNGIQGLIIEKDHTQILRDITNSILGVTTKADTDIPLTDMDVSTISATATESAKKYLEAEQEYLAAKYQSDLINQYIELYTENVTSSGNELSFYDGIVNLANTNPSKLTAVGTDEGTFIQGDGKTVPRESAIYAWMVDQLKDTGKFGIMKSSITTFLDNIKNELEEKQNALNNALTEYQTSALSEYQAYALAQLNNATSALNSALQSGSGDTALLTQNQATALSYYNFIMQGLPVNGVSATVAVFDEEAICNSVQGEIEKLYDDAEVKFPLVQKIDPEKENIDKAMANAMLDAMDKIGSDITPEKAQAICANMEMRIASLQNYVLAVQKKYPDTDYTKFQRQYETIYQDLSNYSAIALTGQPSLIDSMLGTYDEAYARWMSEDVPKYLKALTSANKSINNGAINAEGLIALANAEVFKIVIEKLTNIKNTIQEKLVDDINDFQKRKEDKLKEVREDIDWGIESKTMTQEEADKLLADTEEEIRKEEEDLRKKTEDAIKQVNEQINNSNVALAMPQNYAENIFTADYLDTNETGVNGIKAAVTSSLQDVQSNEFKYLQVYAITFKSSNGLPTRIRNAYGEFKTYIDALINKLGGMNIFYSSPDDYISYGEIHYNKEEPKSPENNKIERDFIGPHGHNVHTETTEAYTDADGNYHPAETIKTTTDDRGNPVKEHTTYNQDGSKTVETETWAQKQMYDEGFKRYGDFKENTTTTYDKSGNIVSQQTTSTHSVKDYSTTTTTYSGNEKVSAVEEVYRDGKAYQTIQWGKDASGNWVKQNVQKHYSTEPEIPFDPTETPDGKLGDFKQGELGDCHFLSALNTLNASEFSSLISANADGTYTVHFRGDYVDAKTGKIYRGPFDITVKEGVDFDSTNGAYSSIDKKWYQLASGDKDVRIIESALMKQFGYDALNFNNAANSQNLLRGTNSYKQVYASNVDLNSISYPTEIGFNVNSFPKTALTATGIDGKNYTQILSEHLDANGNIVIEEKGMTTFIPTNHAYQLKSYDPATDTVELVNPHDTERYIRISADYIRGGALMTVPANTPTNSSIKNLGYSLKGALSTWVTWKSK